MLLFVLEFLGTTELLVILVVALVLFGPRKLPELGRSLGKTLGDFKRQTDDFKRTWEREVELDKLARDVRVDDELREAREALDYSYTPPALEPPAPPGVEAVTPEPEAQSIARGARAEGDAWADAGAAEGAAEEAEPGGVAPPGAGQSEAGAESGAGASRVS